MANLLSMPSISVGLMGRRNQPQGNDLSFLQQLMKQSQQAAQFDAGDAYFTNPAGRPAGNGVPVLENGAVGYVPPTPSAAPAQRERVSFGRVLDRVLGGQTVTEGLDAERARLQAQADAPAAAAESARLAAILRTLPEPLQVAFAANKGEAGKAVASNYEGYTLGAGGMRGGMNGFVASAPTYSTVNDSIYANDRGVSTRTATADPGYDDITQRAKAESDAQLALMGIDVSQQNADTSRISALRPQIANTGQGGITTLINADSTIGQQIQGTPQRPPAAIETEGRISALKTDVTPTLGRMRSLLESGDVITGYAADNRLDAARALAALGNDKAKKEVAATEEYRNTAARLRVGMAKSLGANPSNADLAILEQVTGGNINQNRESLLATIGQGEQMTARQMQAAEQQLQQYGGGAQTGSVARPTSAAEYQALPSGTLFMAPDGSTRRKP